MLETDIVIVGAGLSGIGAAYHLSTMCPGRSFVMLEGREELGEPGFRQSVEDYVTCLHSRNGFSQDRMEPKAAAELDQEMRNLVSPHAIDGMLELDVVVQLIYGWVRG